MKTIEEKAVEFSLDIHNGTNKELPDTRINLANGEIRRLVQMAYILGAKESLRSQWRNVEEELPEDDRIVLVEIKEIELDLRFTTARCVGKDIWDFIDESYVDYNVLRWMPIPEYKPDK